MNYSDNEVFCQISSFRGFVIPVVKYIKKCWESTDTDVSLIR